MASELYEGCRELYEQASKQQQHETYADFWRLYQSLLLSDHKEQSFLYRTES